MKELDELILRDPDDQPVRLGELWADRAQVLAFVRHFG